MWPPEDYAGLARVRQAVRIPIACGENEATVFAFREIIAAGAADIVQPSMTKVGGIGEMKKIAVLAAAANVTFVPHSFYFGPGLAATLHVVASTPGVPYVEMPPGQLSAPLLADAHPLRQRRGARPRGARARRRPRSRGVPSPRLHPRGSAAVLPHVRRCRP